MKSMVLPTARVSESENGAFVLTVVQVLPLPGLQMFVENTEAPLTRMLATVLVESMAEKLPLIWNVPDAGAVQRTTLSVPAVSVGCIQSVSVGTVTVPQATVEPVLLATTSGKPAPDQ